LYPGFFESSNKGMGILTLSNSFLTLKLVKEVLLIEVASLD